MMRQRVSAPFALLALIFVGIPRLGAGQQCNQTQFEPCHVRAFCDPSTGCFCPPGMYGDGEDDCATEGATIRISFLLTGAQSLNYGQTRLKLLSLVNDLYNDTSALPPYHTDSFTFSVRSDVISMEIIYKDFNASNAALSSLKPELMGGELAYDSTTIFYEETIPIHFDFSGNSYRDGRLSIEPRVYTWVTGTNEDPIPIMATGMDVERVYFEPTCKNSGCWVIDVIYSTGENNFNVFYLPKSNNDDTLSFDFNYTGTPLDRTYFPRFFPCGTNTENFDPSFPSMGGIPDSVSACCIPTFKDEYRAVATFEDDTFGLGDPDLATLRTMCGEGGVGAPTMLPSNMPASHLQGFFSDTDQSGERLSQLNTSEVVYTGLVDPFAGIYTATFYLDEVETRRYLSKLTGMVGVEYTIDTFVGLANFKPSGLQFVDMAATQVAIHLEKTNFFTVATHGTNDYTFLQYANLRLVEVYKEDQSHLDDEFEDRLVSTNTTRKAQYVQVTFVVGEKYRVKEAPYDIIPLDSVLVGKGTFPTDSTFKHACLDYLLDPRHNELFSGSEERTSFDEILNQPCGPEAAMCEVPSGIPDSFVAFNVPVGFNWLPEDAADLSAQVYVNFVIQAVNVEALPGGSEQSPDASQITKTTLRASIPVVTGGVNGFCDALTAKTDLKDVARAVIVVGSASTAEELTRLRILGESQSITDSRLNPEDSSHIPTDSIEGGLITLVLQGNESFFGPADRNSARNDFGLELEDVMTIHVMEASDGFDEVGSIAANLVTLIRAPPEDQYDAGSVLRTDGYLLNGAFYMEILRDENRARLQPSAALLQQCNWVAGRPSLSDGIIPANCILRREVSGRNHYPVNNGLPSPMAMELPHCDPTSDQCASTLPATSAAAGAGGEADDVQDFMGMVLGPSSYARQLGLRYSQVLAKRFKLNNLENRAYWINPGYEWAPAQAGGTPLFQLSQKVFLFALIALNENRLGTLNVVGSAGRRRVLLQSASGEEPEAMVESAFEYEITPEKLVADAVGVPEDSIVTFEVELYLNKAQVCLPDIQLMADLRRTLTPHFALTASAFRTVQISHLVINAVEDECEQEDGEERRRSLLQTTLEQYTNAVARVRALVAFEDEAPAINRKDFLNLPGIVDIRVFKGPDVIVSNDFVAPGAPGGGGLANDGGGLGWKVEDPGLLAGGIGVAICVVCILVGTFVVRKKNKELVKLAVEEAEHSKLEAGQQNQPAARGRDVGEEVAEEEGERAGENIIRPAQASEKEKPPGKDGKAKIKTTEDLKGHLVGQLAIEYDSD